jgi:AraC family transcriptional regulator, transcriptional activator of pobA
MSTAILFADAVTGNLLPDDNSLHFEIHSIDSIKPTNVSGATAQKINHFEVLLIKKGNGHLQLDGQDHTLTENSSWCIFPGHFRKLHFTPGAEGYYISFALEFLKLSEGYNNSAAWLEHYMNVAAGTIYKETLPELETIAHKMKWEYNNCFDKRRDLLKGLLNIFLIYFSRNLNKPTFNDTPNREKELVNKFIGLLKKHFYTRKFVNDYASLLAVTPNYLNRTVKKITGHPTSHHIQQQIILEAKRQAIYSSESMKQIAYSLGFDNPAHFSKFFKNNCGVNFTEYKNQLQRV